MNLIGDLERLFATSLYPNLVPIAIGVAVATVLLILFARRRGWFAAARRHPGRSAVVVVLALAVGLPSAWYLGSPLFISTSLNEPPPSAIAPTPSAAAGSSVAPTGAPTPAASASAVVPSVRPTAPGGTRTRGGAARRPPRAGPREPANRHVQGRRRVPFRARHGHADRDRAGQLDRPVRELLGSERTGPVRLRLAGCRRLLGRRHRAGPAQGHRGQLQHGPARRRGPRRFGECRHLVQAVRGPVRGGTARHLNRRRRAPPRP